MPPDWQWGRHALPDRGLASPYSLCHRLEHTESGPKPRFSGGAPRDGQPRRLGRRPPEGAPTRRRGRRKLSLGMSGAAGGTTRDAGEVCAFTMLVSRGTHALGIAQLTSTQTWTCFLTPRDLPSPNPAREDRARALGAQEVKDADGRDRLGAAGQGADVWSDGDHL